MNEFAWEMAKGLMPLVIFIFGLIIVLLIIKLIIRKSQNKIDDIKVKNNICPLCGNRLVEKKGRYGKFIGCSRFPKCRYTVDLKEDKNG